MASQGEDDLQASTTEGFKVGEKKTVEEYAKLGECMKLSSDDRPSSTFDFCAQFLIQNAFLEKNQVCTRSVYHVG